MQIESNQMIGFIYEAVAAMAETHSRLLPIQLVSLQTPFNFSTCAAFEQGHIGNGTNNILIGNTAPFARKINPHRFSHMNLHLLHNHQRDRKRH